MKDITKAKTILESGYTCVLVKGKMSLTSKRNGIVPMVKFLNDGIGLEGFSVADKIVGKAVAMLFVLAKVKEVYAEVLSKTAISVLEANGISYSYKILTDNIINRQGTGLCPMEETVKDIFDCKQAYEKIKVKLASLNISF